MRADEPQRVLFVCLGNICRSPTAEGVTRFVMARQAPNLRVLVDSAGTADYHVGDPPDLRSQRAAMRRGIDLSGLRARQIAARDYQQFDLILAMDRNNLRDLRALQPKESRATLGLFLEYAHDCDVREVPDPYYGTSHDFERVLDLTTAAALGLTAALQNSKE